MPRALRALHSRLFAKREIAACASLYHLLQNCGLCVSKLMGIEQVKPVMRTLLGGELGAMCPYPCRMMCADVNVTVTVCADAFV
eukprot:scaffold120084_cov14-Tisochrysis_lutea.AAC.1